MQSTVGDSVLSNNSQQSEVLTLQIAPAESAIEYKTVVFTGGLHGDKSVYQGYSDEVNERWNSLFNGMPNFSNEAVCT